MSNSHSSGPKTVSVTTVEEALDLIRQSGGRVTNSRRLLIEAFFESAGHQSAEEIAQVLQVHAPDVHLSTIYRNLEELERLGVIVHAHLGHGPATYHLASNPHGHLVCESCGVTVQAPGRLFSSFARAAKTEFGFVVDPHHFAVFGRCNSCKDLAPAP